MVVDVARSFNHCFPKINPMSLPPTYPHVLYLATAELLTLHTEIDQIQWREDLEILREAIWNYSRRWQAAGRFLSVSLM